MFKKNVKKSEEVLSQLSNKEKLDNVKQNNAKMKQKLKFKIKKTYILAAVLVIVIFIIITGVITFLNNKKYEKYEKYEDKMRVYGFADLYNNKSAKTSESVTKTEAVKMAIAATFNTSNISDFAEENTEYENAIWTEYAEDSKITSEDINASNYNKKIKYKDVIMYFENCKIKFLKGESIKDAESNLKDISKYSVVEQAAIKDMIANEIISTISDNLNGNSNIFKGQLNEIVVNFVEKYNTITMDGEKININPEKIPSNNSEYPYTLSNIDKSIYELPFVTIYAGGSISPKNMYAAKKDIYIQIKNRAESYYNAILNIDYRTITVENLSEQIEDYVAHSPKEEDLNYYVKYVKDNEIIIQGSAKMQEPIIYLDGSYYRARLNLTFDIKHSKTDKNLLYLNIFEANDIKYEKTNYSIFVDSPLTTTLKTNNYYIYENGLYDNIQDKYKTGIIQEIVDNTSTMEE